jgi:hypothetical protein
MEAPHYSEHPESDWPSRAMNDRFLEIAVTPENQNPLARTPISPLPFEDITVKVEQFVSLSAG